MRENNIELGQTAERNDELEVELEQLQREFEEVVKEKGISFTIVIFTILDQYEANMKSLEEKLTQQQEIVKKNNAEMESQKDQMEKNNNEMIQQVRALQDKINQEDSKSASKLKEYEERMKGLQAKLDQAAEEQIASQVEVKDLTERCQSYAKKISELERQVNEYSRLNTSLQNGRDDAITSQNGFLEAQLETQKAMLESKDAESELRISRVREEGFSKWHELEQHYLDTLKRTKDEYETAKQYAQSDKKASDIRQQMLRKE